MKLTQNMDVEIQVFGMVEQENGDCILGEALPIPQSPEFWDIHVKAYPEGFEKDYHLLLELDDIIHRPELDYWLNKLSELFPDADVTST